MCSLLLETLLSSQRPRCCLRGFFLTLMYLCPDLVGLCLLEDGGAGGRGVAGDLLYQIGQECPSGLKTPPRKGRESRPSAGRRRPCPRNAIEKSPAGGDRVAFGSPVEGDVGTEPAVLRRRRGNRPSGNSVQLLVGSHSSR